MKKILILGVLSGFLFICASCSTESLEYQPQIDTTYIFEETMSYYNIEQDYTLDLQYKKDKAICENNSDITNVNLEYAEKWYNLGKAYYSLIVSEDLKSKDSEKKEIVNSIHNNWELYASQRIADEKTRLESIYDGGTIVPIKLSYFKYNLYRSHALELYNICIEFNIGCETP